MAAIATEESRATIVYDPRSDPRCLGPLGWIYSDCRAAGRVAASETATAAGVSITNTGSSLAGGVTDAIRASAEPIAETASATRYIAVGATIAVVAIVIAVIAIVIRTYL